MRLHALNIRLFMFVCIIPLQLSAQDLPLQFRHYDIGDGLSLNTVRTISQDSKGFMWIGTADGLNRFDGRTFEIYRPVAFDTTSLSDWDISSILHDFRGRQWVGTYNGGLNLRDASTGRFYHFKHHRDFLYSLSHDSVTTLFEDRDHRLWIGTVNGLNRLISPDDAEGLTLESWAGQVRFQCYTATPETTSLSNPYVTCITMDRDGWLWVGTDEGLNVTHPDSMRFIRFFCTVDAQNGLKSNYIRCLHCDEAGRIWIGTEYGGLSCLILPEPEEIVDRRKQLCRAEFQTYLPEKDNPGSISSDVVYSIFEDSAGILWLGTEQGLNRFDTSQHRFENWKNEPDDPVSLNNNTIWTITKDHSGVYWLGTDGGINTFHEKKHRFLKIQHDPGQPESLSHPYVWDLEEDAFNFIWVGTTFGLNRFDPATGHIQSFFYDPNRPCSLRDNNIMSLCVDRDNMLWVGLNGSGLDRTVIRESGTVEFIHMDCTDKGLGSYYILSLYEDRDGALWIGTWNKGLCKILPEERHALADRSTTLVPSIRFFPDSNDPYSISPGRIYAMLQDHTGALWIATDVDGLNVLSLEHVRVKDPAMEPVRFAHFRHNPADPKSLSSNIVMCIHEDRYGDLWFGTYGGGLSHYHRQKNEFSFYNTSDGLPNNIVYGIMEDGEGYLWLSTNKGLSKFNPETGDFHNFTVHDGLQSYEFNSGAFLKTHDGYMLFGGICGFNFFHPGDISLNTYIPPVVISDLRVDDRTVPVLSDRIRLSYRQQLLSIEFAALSYIIPEKNRYRYRMTPLNKTWIDAGSEYKATYTHLSPGNYTFQVLGSNNDGVWNPKGASLHIRISPPFWQTFWFRLFLILLFFGCVYLIYSIRTRSVQRLNRMLEKKVQERTEALETANEELQTALENVNTLEGLLPICASCKRIRDENGDWHQVDVYIRQHSDVRFSHGLCPECYQKYEKEL
ncbi:histidine kinase [bacterium]|nr:histidine kinase [bacterium]